MDERQLLALKPELDRFLDRFAPIFGPDGNLAHTRRFVQGLLHGGERRNAENIAQATRGGPVRTLRAFISTGGWSAREVLAQMRSDVLEVFRDEDAVWNSDETGFPKKGTKSVGVKRRSQPSSPWTGPSVAIEGGYAALAVRGWMSRRKNPETGLRASGQVLSYYTRQDSNL